MAAIGISFGVSNTAVAFYQNGKVEVIANDQGHRTTPAYVSFTDSEILTGEAAKGQVTINTENTVYDFKRLLGKKSSDPSFAECAKKWPFKIETHGKASVLVTHLEESKSFTPEELLGYSFKRMKVTADVFVGKEVSQAVVAVPAYYDEAQRKAVKDAAGLAGLEIIKIIDESIAAVVAYGLENKDNENQNVVVFDLGGGTLDVTVLTVSNGNCSVKATANNLHLGGEDFDTRLVTYFAQEFQKKHKKDMSGSARALRRLKAACELARRTLSQSAQASVEIDSLFDGLDFYSNLSLARLQDLCGDLFRTCLETVEKALKDAQMEKNSIGTIILAGGASRMKRLQEMVDEFFDGKAVLKSINLDEVVAYGCAVQAAQLTGDFLADGSEGLDSVLLSLGIATQGGVVGCLIPRGTDVPATVSRLITTASDYQSVMTVRVYEGERAMAEDNVLLGTVELHDVRPAPRGTTQTEVTLSVGKSGQLRVILKELPEGKSAEGLFPVYTSIAGEDDEKLEKKIIDAEKHRAIDEAQKEDIAARNLLLSVCCYIEAMLETPAFSKSVSEDDKTALRRKCTAVTGWLSGSTDPDRDELDEKQKDLEDAFKAVLERLVQTDSAGLSVGFQDFRKTLENLLVLKPSNDVIDARSCSGVT